MAETLEGRQKIARQLEDVQHSLSALVEKAARVQMELEASDTDTAERLATLLSPLSDAAGEAESIKSDFEMETNRRQNEGEL